jgi:hypothetical protein
MLYPPRTTISVTLCKTSVETCAQKQFSLMPAIDLKKNFTPILTSTTHICVPQTS